MNDKEIRKILDEKLYNNDINIVDIIMKYKTMFEEEDERIEKEKFYYREGEWIECWRHHLDDLTNKLDILIERR